MNEAKQGLRSFICYKCREHLFMYAGKMAIIIKCFKCACINRAGFSPEKNRENLLKQKSKPTEN